jgi:hypothetical protein
MGVATREAFGAPALVNQPLSQPLNSSRALEMGDRGDRGKTVKIIINRIMNFRPSLAAQTLYHKTIEII